MGIHWDLILDAAVFVATSSYMEPSKNGFHIEEEEEGRECVSLDSSSFNRSCSECIPTKGSLIFVVASS